MTAYAIPPRKWADDGTEVAPAPTVLVSSRDGVAVPGVRGAVSLVKALAAAGWEVGTAYALADVPHGWGRTRAPYQLASVGVRFALGDRRGWACWYEVDGKGWRYSTGYLGMQQMGLRELTKALFEVTP